MAIIAERYVGLSPLVRRAAALLICSWPFVTSPVAAADYTEIPVENGGIIQGSVLLGSASEETNAYSISKDLDVCGTEGRDVPFVRASGDNLLDTIVYLADISTGKPVPDDVAQIKIDQASCVFSQRVSVVMQEGTIEVSNSDPIMHNFHAFELIGKVRRTMMNISQPDKGTLITQPIKMRRGTGMKIECDAHEFMHAWVFVARNPYFALVDGEGKFSIADIPPGTWAIRAWHGVLGEIDGGTIEVTASGTANVSLSY